MSINYTVTEVTKEFIKVKYQDDREVVIPIRTWVDKDWIEANIQQKCVRTFRKQFTYGTHMYNGAACIYLHIFIDSLFN